MLTTEVLFGTNGRVHICTTPMKNYNHEKNNEILIYNTIFYLVKYFFNDSDGVEAVEETLSDFILNDYPDSTVFSANFYGAIPVFFTKLIQVLPPSKVQAFSGLMQDQVFQPPLILTNNVHNNDGVKIDKVKYKYTFKLVKKASIISKLKLNFFAPNTILYPMSVPHMISYTLIHIDGKYHALFRKYLCDLLVELRSNRQKEIRWLHTVTQRTCSSNGLVV